MRTMTLPQKGPLPLPQTPTAQEINKNFIIRWRYHDERSNCARLIGAGKYEEKFGNSYMAKHFNSAMSSPLQKIEFRIRGLYIISFASR